MIKICPNCEKKYEEKHITYPCNLDDTRDSYINCPYCGYVIENVRLRGNEDINTYKIDE